MPQTFQRLQHSASTLGYAQKGLTVTHGAVSKETSEMWFYTGGKDGKVKEGIENLGLGSCSKMSKTRALVCETVKVYSLRDYIQQKVRTDIEDHPINILSIDVEGFDGDVLLGASPAVLEQVEYLEFEYNWMGSWKDQHLADMVQMLDETAHMTCYWAGIDWLWRITNCWMQYYDIHSWSNVACVNRKLVPRLAKRMEAIFQRTLQEKNNKQWTVVPITTKVKKQLQDHELISTDPQTLAKKYYVGSR